MVSYWASLVTSYGRQLTDFSTLLRKSSEGSSARTITYFRPLPRAQYAAFSSGTSPRLTASFCCQGAGCWDTCSFLSLLRCLALLLATTCDAMWRQVSDHLKSIYENVCFAMGTEGDGYLLSDIEIYIGWNITLALMTVTNTYGTEEKITKQQHIWRDNPVLHCIPLDVKWLHLGFRSSVWGLRHVPALLFFL